MLGLIGLATLDGTHGSYLGSLVRELFGIPILCRMHPGALVQTLVFHRRKVGLLRSQARGLDEVPRDRCTLARRSLELDSPPLGQLIVLRRQDLCRGDDVEVEGCYISPNLRSQVILGEEVRSLQLLVVACAVSASAFSSRGPCYDGTYAYTAIRRRMLGCESAFCRSGAPNCRQDGGFARP